MTSSETPQSLKHCLNNTIVDKLGICSSLSNLNNNGTNSSLNSIDTTTTINPGQQLSSGIIANNGCNNYSQVSSTNTDTSAATTNSAPPSPPSSLTTASIGGVNGGSSSPLLSYCQASQLHHQQTNGRSPTKITENHLSTKLLRSTSAPYPRAHLPSSKHPDQSNHFAINGVNSTLVTGDSNNSGAFQNQQDSSTTMLDNVNQLEESLILESQQNINNNNHQHLHSDYQSGSNGNCINSEFQQQVIDNQQQQQQHSSSCLPSSDINSVSNNSECPSLSTTSCDLELDASGNSSSGDLVVDINSAMPSGPTTNGMTSPGGSLDENDCDNK